MKTVGIIGGFGPEATAKFQLEIVEIFRALKVKTRPPLLIWLTPIPIQIEKNFILKSKDLSKFLPFLIKGSQRLENGGADFLVIPCNSLHLLIKDLQKATKLPILNLIEETGLALKKEKIRRIGIIASQMMIKSGLHQESLIAQDIEPVLPFENDQCLINESIDRILTNQNLKKAANNLLRVTKSLKHQGIKDILLACTDLQLIFPKVSGTRNHDTLHILAESTAREILNERR